MKRTFTILTAGLLVFTAISCGGGAKKPEDVAKAFINAINDEDFDTAKDYATDETKQMLGMMESMMSGMDEDMKGEKGEFKEVKDKDVKEDKATITYCCDENGEDDEVKLKKVDGEWKVHMDKENPGAGGGAGAGGAGGGAGS